MTGQRQDGGFEQRLAARHGLTLVELLSAMVVMVMIAGAVGALALTVENAGQYSNGRIEAAQHARVVIGRIQRTLHAAHSSEQFPGFAAFPRTDGGWVIPDTIAVWMPSARPANPDGLPLWKELVIYCPDEANASRLLELSAPNDNRTVPALTDLSTWNIQLQRLKSANTTRRIELTDLLRTASFGISPGAKRYGCVRFHVVVHPSASQWQSYRNGNLNWQDLSWPQDIYGSRTGLRQAWCRFELQLYPGREARERDPQGDMVIPFFGSAARYCEVHK